MRNLMWLIFFRVYTDTARNQAKFLIECTTELIIVGWMNYLEYSQMDVCGFILYLWRI